MEYVDYELAFTALGDDEYQVRACSRLAGTTRARTRFPLDAATLRDRLKDLEIALLRSDGSGRRSGALLSKHQEDVSHFGAELFGAIMPARIEENYRRALHLAREKNHGLRLRLTIPDSKKASLPWEFMYDPNVQDFVGLSPDTPIVRFLELEQAREPLVVTPPLKILAVTASPDGLPPVDKKREQSRIERALNELITSGYVKLEWLDSGTEAALKSAFRRSEWHVLHFIGHGAYDPDSDRGFLAFEKGEQDKSVHPVTSVAFARHVRGCPTLRLVVLNSCEGARADADAEVFSSTAEVLMDKGGVPAVVAMQHEITNEAAIAFSEAFYRALADSAPVDRAIADARSEVLSALNDQTLEWGTPVLFLQSASGELFEFAGEPIRVVSIELTPLGPLELARGGRARLAARPVDQNGSTVEGRSVLWKSDAPEVVEVGRDGSLFAVSGGTATITASSGEITATKQITVASPFPWEKVGPIAGGLLTLALMLFVWWRLSDGSQLRDARGGDDQTRTPPAPVTLAAPTLRIHGATSNLRVGDDVALSVTLLDSRGEEQSTEATWRSSDRSRLTVSDAGVVTARAPGLGWIVARAQPEGSPGPVADSVQINAFRGDPPPPPRVARVELSPSGSITLQEGTTRAFSARVISTRGQSLSRPVSWASSQAAVASVTSAGLVQALSEGRTTVTATVDGKRASVEIEVARPVPTGRPVAGVTLSPSGTITLDEGRTARLAATVTDATGQPLDSAVAYSSDRPAIAHADQHGVITANTPGEATITAAAGGIRASVVVRVTFDVASARRAISALLDRYGRGLEKLELDSVREVYGAFTQDSLETFRRLRSLRIQMVYDPETFEMDDAGRAAVVPSVCRRVSYSGGPTNERFDFHVERQGRVWTIDRVERKGGC